MGEMNPPCAVTFAIWVCTIIGVGLYGGSFQVLGPLNCGLKKNSITSAIDTTKVYTSGRYFLGLGNTFLAFPLTLQVVEFSDRSSDADAGLLSAATLDGQSIELEISFQYRLMISRLHDIYAKFAFAYEANYVSKAVTVIKNIVSQRYRMQDYFTDRPSISAVLHAELNDALKRDPYYAVVEYFQLRRVKPPSRTDDQIVLKIIKEQQVLQASVQQNSTLIRVGTSVVLQDALQQVSVINAQAAAQAKIIAAQAQALGISIAVNSSAQAYKSFKDNLGFTNQQLLKYIFYENVRTLPDTAQLISDLPSVFLDVAKAGVVRP